MLLVKDINVVNANVTPKLTRQSLETEYKLGYGVMHAISLWSRLKNLRKKTSFNNSATEGRMVLFSPQGIHAISAPDRAVAVTDLAIDAPCPATVSQFVLQLRWTWRLCTWPNWMPSHQRFGLYFGIWRRCCGALSSPLV